MTSLSLRKLKHNDNYGTPDYAWKMILPFIPKDKILYDGFYLNGIYNYLPCINYNKNVFKKYF